MQIGHRFNFTTQYEEKNYDHLVKICKAPLVFIEENIQDYDLNQRDISALAKQIERDYQKQDS